MIGTAERGEPSRRRKLHSPLIELSVKPDKRLGLRTRISGEYRRQGGQLQPARKPPALPGLNVNHNHDLKNIFKSAATQAGTCKDDPLGEFYQNLLTSGMEPAMARLTLARKIAAIALIIWKKGERFDPAKLKQQAA